MTSLSTSSITSTSAASYQQSVQPAEVLNGSAEAVRDRRCGKCQNEKAPSICGRCKAINYCDAVCQKAHWAAHKTFCKKPEITDAASEINPSSGSSATSDPKEDGLAVTKAKICYRIAIAKIEQRQFEDAIRFAMRGRAESPPGPDNEALWYVPIVEAKFRLNHFSQAIDSAHEALALGPTSSEIISHLHLTMAKSWLALFSPDKALAAAESGLRANPEPDIKSGLEFVMKNARDQLSPQAEVSQGAKADAAALAYFRVALKKLEVGECEESIKYAMKGLAEGPTDSDIMAQLYYCIAQCRWQLFQQAMAQQDDDDNAGKIGDFFDKGLEAAEKSVAARPKNQNVKANAYLCLSNFLSRRRRFQAAFEAAQEGLAAGPTSKKVKSQLYRCAVGSLISLELYDKAKLLAKAGLAENPETQDARATLHYYYRPQLF